MKLAGLWQSINFLVMILFPKPIYFLLLLLGLLSACQSWRYQRLARLPDTLAEASGLYIAAADTCWWLNDSGGQPSIYATNLKGDLLDSLAIAGAHNRDWEELTHDEQGYLYLCDIGNNLNARKDLVIYKWKKGMKVAEQISFSYPDQTAFPPPKSHQNFDAEACFWYADSLYIFSKNRAGDGNYFTKLYALPAQAGTYTAVLKDSLSLQDRVVTAAAINAQGTEIALATYDYRRDKLWPLKSSLLIITDFQAPHFLSGKLYRQEIPPSRLGRQYEAIDYLQDGSLILSSEGSPVTPPFMAQLKMRKRK